MILVEESSHQSASLIWYTWSQDPIKAAVLRAILNCQFRLNYYYFSRVMSVALGQTKVRVLHSIYYSKWRMCITEELLGIFQD